MEVENVLGLFKIESNIPHNVVTDAQPLITTIFSKSRKWYHDTHIVCVCVCVCVCPHARVDNYLLYVRQSVNLSPSIHPPIHPSIHQSTHTVFHHLLTIQLSQTNCTMYVLLWKATLSSNGTLISNGYGSILSYVTP